MPRLKYASDKSPKEPRYFSWQLEDITNFCAGSLAYDFNDHTPTRAMSVYSNELKTISEKDLLESFITKSLDHAGRFSLLVMADVEAGLADRVLFALIEKLEGPINMTWQGNPVTCTFTLSDYYLNPNSNHQVRDCQLRITGWEIELDPDEEF